MRRQSLQTHCVLGVPRRSRLDARGINEAMSALTADWYGIEQVQYQSQPVSPCTVRLLCCKIELIRQLGAASFIRIPLPLPNLDCLSIAGDSSRLLSAFPCLCRATMADNLPHSTGKTSCRLYSLLDYSLWHPGEHWLPWALCSTVARLQHSNPPRYVQDVSQDDNQSHRDQAQIGMSRYEEWKGTSISFSIVYTSPVPSTPASPALSPSPGLARKMQCQRSVS